MAVEKRKPVPADIDIAWDAKFKPIINIAGKYGIADEYLDHFGQFKAKVRLEFLRDKKHLPVRAKYIDVTAITPTPLGEGKTTTTVGLTQGFGAIGRTACCAIRQPSMGPTFGIKGGAAGGGYSQVVPMVDFNLHLTSDIHAVSAAHNLCATALDARIYHESRWSDAYFEKQGLRRFNFDPYEIHWNRVVDNRIYSYSSGGKLLCEFLTSSGVVWNRDVIYLGSRAVAEIDHSGIVHMLHSDHLGTPRLSTNGSTGALDGVQAFGPYGDPIGGNWGYPLLTGYTGHLQPEPNGLIYMRGRFYSPAWHCFLNSDQGADPNQLNQYAYAGGNPMMNIDPSGLSWLSNVWDDLVHHPGRMFCDPLSLTANWNQDRQAVEVGAAVVACVLIDIYAPELASSNNAILSSVGQASVWAGPAASNAVIGGAAGGAIGGTWKSAAQGVVAGYMLGSMYTCVSAGMASGSASEASGNGYWNGFFNGTNAGTGFNTTFKTFLSSTFGPPQDLLGYGRAVVGAGIMAEASDQGGTPWNNFRDGLELGAFMGGFSYGYNPMGGAWNYLGNQMLAEGAYNIVTGHSGFSSALENGLPGSVNV